MLCPPNPPQTDNSIEYSPWTCNNSPASDEILPFYGTRMFACASTRARHSSTSRTKSTPTSIFRCLTSFNRISSSPTLCKKFRSHVKFLRWGLVSASPNPQAGGPPLVRCPRLPIQYIRCNPPLSGGLFLHPQLRGRAMRWWQGPTYHDCSSNNSITGWKVQQTTQHANIWYTVTVFYITFIHEGKRNQSTRAALKYCPRIRAANVLKELVRGCMN